MNLHEKDGERLLRISEVTKLTSLSRSTIYALVEAGRFPSPIKVGERRVAWRLSAVRDWIRLCEAVG